MGDLGLKPDSSTPEEFAALIGGEIRKWGHLINVAGILRERMLFNMTEAEWDAVVDVHMKGHFAPTRWAATYWREQAKAGITKPRNLVHTSSTSGLFSNPGQSNYGAAKTGIATFSQIVAKELSRYNVKSNTIAPGARIENKPLAKARFQLRGNRAKQRFWHAAARVRQHHANRFIRPDLRARNVRTQRQKRCRSPMIASHIASHKFPTAQLTAE